MKVTRKMRRLSESDVQFISLVDRGANRIPFRIQKQDKTRSNQEQNMTINLNGFGRVMKKGEKDAAPTLALIVTKSEPSAEYLADLKAAGFKTEVVKQEDGTFTIQQGELPAQGTETVLKAGDGSILVMKGFKPWSDGLETFSDFLNAKGYYSGVCTATDALRSCLDDILSDVASPADAGPRVEEALNDFHAYIMTLIKALPTVAFKAEKIARKAEVAGTPGRGVQDTALKPAVTTASVGEAGTDGGKGPLAPNSDAGYAGSSEALKPGANTGKVGDAGVSSGTASLAPNDKLPSGETQGESAGHGGSNAALKPAVTTGAVGDAGTSSTNGIAAGDIAGKSSDKPVDPKAAMNEAGLTGKQNMDGMPITVHINVRKADGTIKSEAELDAEYEVIRKQGNAERVKNLEAVKKAKPDAQMEPTGKDAQVKNLDANKNAGSKVSTKAEDDAALAALIANAIAPALAGVTQKFESLLTEKVDGLTKKVDAVSQKQAETDGKVTEAVQKAEGASAALRTTVVGSALNTESAAVSTVRQARKAKSEGDPRTGCFDTAYLRGRG